MIKDDKNRIDKSLANHDDYYMSLALKAAYGAQSQDEVPIGAVLVDERGSVIASAGNTTRTRCDPTGHAEVNVLRAAGKLIGNHRLLGCTLFVTLEPCAMCAGAISHARLKRVVIAASDPKGGAVWNGPKFFEQPTCHWQPQIDHGPLEQEAGKVLRDFFKQKRSR